MITGAFGVTSKVTETWFDVSWALFVCTATSVTLPIGRSVDGLHAQVPSALTGALAHTSTSATLTTIRFVRWPVPRTSGRRTVISSPDTGASMVGGSGAVVGLGGVGSIVVGDGESDTAGEAVGDGESVTAGGGAGAELPDDGDGWKTVGVAATELAANRSPSAVEANVRALGAPRTLSITAGG